MARALAGAWPSGAAGRKVAITVTVPKAPDGVRRSFSAFLIRRPVALGMATRADWSVARPVAALMRIALPLAGLTLNRVIRRLPTLAVIDPFPAGLTWSAESVSLRRPFRSTSAPLVSRRTAGDRAPVETGRVSAVRETRTGLVADILTPSSRRPFSPLPSSDRRLEPVPAGSSRQRCRSPPAQGRGRPDRPRARPPRAPSRRRALSCAPTGSWGNCASLRP